MLRRTPRPRMPADACRTCADFAGELIGSVAGGPRDASTNKRYLEEAILADFSKRAKKRR